MIPILSALTSPVIKITLSFKKFAMLKL
jgi:hypothetical protein